VQDTCVGNTNALLNSGAATMSVRRSTITGVGEGIRVGSGAVDVHSTLIVSNGASVVGTLAVDEFNMINGSAQGAGLETDGNGFPVLKDNGGPTFTVALVPGSPAINTGNPGITGGTDQRGLPRVVGGRADIGAFEVQASASPQKSAAKPSAPSS